MEQKGELKVITNVDIYRCYSDPLKDFLIDNDIRYFLVARDIVTNKKFYAFEKNNRFLTALEQWESTNPKK